MPDIGFYHPLIVHFAIGLVMVGVLFRWISFSGRALFTGPAAAALIFLGTAAAVAAAWSGNDAHIAVEDMPGIATAVGIRSGDPADVGRLLLAGLYHQAQLDEKANRSADAAILMEIAARRFPSDEAVQVLAAESLLVDRHDPAAALAALSKVMVPTDERRWRFRHGWLTADALDALGQTAAAQATLRNLLAEFPDSERVRRRLEQAGRNTK